MAITGIRRLFQLVARPFKGPGAVDDEIAFHLDAQVRDLVRKGWSEPAARAEARRRFGDLIRYRRTLLMIDAKAQVRVARGQWWGDLGQDLRDAGRMLRRAPTLSAAVVLTLGLGIGANAATFGLMDRLLFKPPAGVFAPDRIGRFSVTETDPRFGSFTNRSVSYRVFADQAALGNPIGEPAAYATNALSYGRGASARSVQVTVATASFWRVLGVTPQLGRLFTDEEDRPGAGAPVAVVSDRFWRHELGGRPEALGKVLLVGTQAYTVIGVAPRGFVGLDLSAVDLWLPLHAGAVEVVGKNPAWMTDVGWEWLRLISRFPVAGEQGAAAARAAQLFKAAKRAADPGLDDRYRVVTRYEPVVGVRGPRRSRQAMVAALLAAVSVMVLLIASANVANLLLARAVGRRREIAVRLSLGIGRGRLLRLLALEGVILAAVGGAAALAIAQVGGEAVRRFLLPDIDFVEATVDLRVLGLTMAVAALTGILVGLVPALQVSRPDLTAALKAGGSGGGRGGDRRQSRLRSGLLLAQAGLSVMLLIGAGLFVQSLRRALNVDLGFAPERVLAVSLDLGLLGYTADQRIQFFRGAEEHFASFPGVERASLAVAVPFQGRYSYGDPKIPGRDSVPRLPTGAPGYVGISPSYPATVGLRLIAGRALTAADRTGAPAVMLINQAMAKGYWPNESPLGRCARFGADSMPCREIVGIVANVNEHELIEQPSAQFYVPLNQSAGFTRDRVLFLRTRGRPETMVSSVRRELQAMIPNLPYAEIQPLADVVDPLVQPWRLGATMLMVFGGLALLVAVLGLYSVLSYVVAQRTSEFGVRTALGAPAGALRAMIFRQAVGVTLSGIAVGAAGAWIGSRWLDRLLFQTSSREPFVYLIVAGILLAAAAAAALAPAERAARADPMEALRAE